MYGSSFICRPVGLRKSSFSMKPWPITRLCSLKKTDSLLYFAGKGCFVCQCSTAQNRLIFEISQDTSDSHFRNKWNIAMAGSQVPIDELIEQYASISSRSFKVCSYQMRLKSQDVS